MGGSTFFFAAAALLIALHVPLMAPKAFAQGMCAASMTGEPCPQGGIATLAPAEPELNLGAGNPIHIVTGNKYQRETDLPANPHAPGLEIVRHYNSSDPQVSPTGPGWRLSYDTQLFFRAGHWQIVQADGSRILFPAPRSDEPYASGQPAEPPRHRHGSLRKENGFWTWTWPDGRQLRFDADGRLAQIRLDETNQVDIYRHSADHMPAHAVKAVANQRGQSLSMHYRVEHGRAYLDRISTPRGVFSYRHDAHVSPAVPVARLRQVIRPDGMQRHYLYETERQSGNAYALTGIVLHEHGMRRSQRINTWAYDLQGRAILSIAGDPDSRRQRLDLHYDRVPGATRPGLTTIVSDGLASRFDTLSVNGRHRLAAVSGASCPGCASSGNHVAYDERGRLLAVNLLQLERDDAGALRELRAPASGWPGLIMRYSSQGLRSNWQASLTGLEHVAYTKHGQPERRRLANGDEVRYRYDRAGRPILQLEQRAGVRQDTRLTWHGSQLARIAHPHETEARRYDEHGRLVQRTIHRMAERAAAGMIYTERFEYDARHRLIVHHLPEGGSLHYQWGPQTRLLGIAWHDASGRRHPVILSSPGQDGYEYGNGARLRARQDRHGNLRQLVLSGNAGVLWTSALQYDAWNRLIQETHRMPELAWIHRWRYAYDANHRLIGADRHAKGDMQPGLGADDTLWYAWHADGSLAAGRSRRDGNVRSDIARDASGLPHRLGDLQLQYSPSRRLHSLHRNGRPLARYYHNAFGQRIVKRHDGQETHYFYLDNQLVAQREPGLSQARGHPLVSRRYIHAGHVLVGLIDYRSAAQGDSGNPVPDAASVLHYVHADAIGAPRLVTDTDQRIRWAADYTPGGHAYAVTGDMTLDMRLPGQVADAETGWHDNILRHYLPASGQYLEPDPLGPVPGNQALGYARQQPKRYIDPYGLLLFAFDGTRLNADTESNVWMLGQLYRDGPVYYHSGPGTPLYMNWDAITAWRASRILDTQWQWLLNALYQAQEAPPARSVPIDIIGFSRGAALARHFGNVIGQHVQGGRFTYSDALRGTLNICVDLRFMGLFDSVAQFGLGGVSNGNYDLSIASAWQWVAHAVALNEHRWTFPLASAASQDNPNVVEAPFIGAHSDIGGGALEDERERIGDLADVSLNWMLWQARMATVAFDDPDQARQTVAAPFINDARTTLMRQIMNGDRAVQDATGAARHAYQNDHPTLGGERRASVEALIELKRDWRTTDEQAIGTVDMEGYRKWLEDELGWENAPV